MTDRPDYVFDNDARWELYRSLLTSRGLAPGDISGHTMNVANMIGATANSLYVRAGTNPVVLRFFAATFELWARTFDGLAERSDAAISEHAARGMADLDALLSNPRPLVKRTGNGLWGVYAHRSDRDPVAAFLDGNDAFTAARRLAGGS